MDKKPKFFCESCGAEVRQNDKFCRVCGKFFSSVKCPSCGKTGNPALFSAGCPVCGYAVHAETGEGRRDMPASRGNPNTLTDRTVKSSQSERLPVWVFVSCGILLVVLFVIFLAYFKLS